MNVERLTDNNVTCNDNGNSTGETTETSDSVTNKLDNDEIADFIKENRNKNTVKKTNADLNNFYRFTKTINETRKLENIPPTELNDILAHFFVKARRQDGNEFEPDTLTSFSRSFDRHLREHGRQYSILTDRHFEKAREALASKRKQLRRFGKGQKPNKALGLTDDQIQQLWLEKQLGDHSPSALLQTIWFNNTIHFGWRARDEHRKAKLGDFTVKREEGPQGTEYVEWTIERGSKTRTGEKETVPLRAFNPKMYATGGEKCPVKMFKNYLSRRPVGMRNPEDPFYLATISNPVSQIWFKQQPLGKNSLGTFMKKMCKAAEITGRHTNHSARRTMITTLRHQNVEPLNIIALAGQRNLKSLDSYSEASFEQQKGMSMKLSEKVQPPNTCETKKEKIISKSKPLSTCSAMNIKSPQQKSAGIPDGMFAGANFQNCSFSFGVDFQTAVQSRKENSPPAKRSFKRILSLDSSDEEL